MLLYGCSTAWHAGERFALPTVQFLLKIAQHAVFLFEQLFVCVCVSMCVYLNDDARVLVLSGNAALSHSHD